ncbi:hypothetical protein GGE68_002917 [Rhizobium leguminosarum]|uniref:hypothetical protein n=1 Tax=Rhizobium leguminosarum TaxID=384 RepID=UPI0016089385|nr:hypothetical protein [Rhizobium leguminosarum]MBB5664720.1 hypothetical protein [Rhizobium leguminosarum]
MIRTLIQDTLLAMLMAVIAIVMLVLPSVNPAAKDDPAQLPGNLVASIAWPAGSTDVDLWVQAGDDLAVGYSNKSGRVWSLLRDDLGTANDDTPLNFESAFTRGLPDGEYAVNVRCFGCAKVPVPVSVEVRLAEGGVIWKGTVDLLKDKSERTAIRFRMAGGQVVPGSASQVFKQMKRGEG